MLNKYLKVQKLLTVGVFTLGLVVMNTTAQQLPAPDEIGPSSVTAFPPGFEAFNPPVTNVAAAAGVPEIAEWTKQNQPGDTMALTAENMSLYTGNAEGRDTRFIFYGEGSGFSDGLIQRIDGRQCALTLPGTLPANKMYLLWPRNGNGFGSPVAINQTEAWWVGPDKVAAGEAFAVNGRNLSPGSGTTYLWIEEIDLWITSNAGNDYHAEFTAPAGLANGTYTLWAHNGTGREYGWSKPLQITIQDPVEWNGITINVVTDYGAVGDGIADDTTAINNALAAAASLSRPTVYFPAGTYAVSSSITAAKNDMRLLGAGMASTKITSHTSFSGEKLFHISGQYEQLTFANLTIDSGVNMTDVTPLFEMKGASHVTFDSVHFTTLNHPDRNYDAFNGLEFYGAEYFKFENCKFTLGHLINLKGSRQCSIKNCDFYGIVDNQLFLNTGVSDQMSVIDCTAQNYDANSSWGMCQGRFFYARQSHGRLSNVYFAGNETIDLTVRADFTENQNTGEQYMQEFGETRFRGYPTDATENTVKFSDISSTFDRMTIAIIEGKGQGQYRDVLSADTGTDTVTVAENWSVIPDDSSLIVIGTFPVRHVLWNNTFDGVERAVVTDVPSTAGVMPYGSQFDMVVANNSFHQLKHGISLWEIQNTLGANEVNRPLFFNLFMDNTITRTRRAIDISLPKYSGGPSVWDTCLLGNVFRRNTISDTTEDVVRHRTWDSSYRIDLMVYDSNSVSDWTGNCIDRANESYRTIQKNQIYVGNTFTASGGRGIQIGSSDTPAFHGNTWTGFSTIYAGSSPGSILELPNRIASVGSQELAAEIPVVNNGTDTLNWTANTTSPWVSITSSGGTIAGEGSFNTLAVQVDTNNIPDNETEAIITVTAGEQVKQVTVEYSTAAALPPPPDGPPDPVLSSIEISGPASIDEQTTGQFVCTATYSDGATQTIAPDWSENSSYTTINSSGLLNAGNVTTDQNMTITASYGGKTDTHIVTINYVAPTLSSITISGPASIDEETTAQFTCTANYSDGTSAAISPSWSENSSSSSISTSGLLTAGNVTSDQSVTITASFGGKSDTHSLTIQYVGPVLTSIAISGPASVDEQTTAQYSCTATYSDGTSATVVPSWSENSSATTINSNGQLTAGNVTSDKSVTVTASFGGQTDTHAVTINYIPPVLTGISISGVTSLDEETSAQYTCTANWSDGTSATVVPSWSENSSYATISAGGVLNAGDVTIDRSLTITASYGGQSDTHGVTILYVEPPVVLTGISITGPAELDENSTADFSCTASYSDGTTESVNPAWSENAGFASINSSGVISVGNIDADSTLIVTASYEGFADTQEMSVLKVGTRIVYPLNGFSGKLVRARLWDDVAGELIPLGEMNSPDELVITDVNPNQWYWVVVEEYDEQAADWTRAHANWISM